MNEETVKTEQYIQTYKENPTKENLKTLVHQVQKTIFLIPALLPEGVNAEEIQKKAQEQKEKFTLPEGMHPRPCILKNKEGVTFLPIYTSQNHIPNEPKYDLIMHVPFKGCYNMALNPKLAAEGAAINPFTDNLLFKKELLEAVRKEEALAANANQVKLTPQQYQIMMRQKAEFHDLPYRIFKEGEAFINKISDERESVVEEVYRNAYQKAELYPYREADFSVMPLNISEQLLLIRIDLPEVKEAAQLCYRIYVTLNPQNQSVHYFMIERGKEKGQKNLGGIDSEGKHIEYGEAPVEGAELQKIIDLVQ